MRLSFVSFLVLLSWRSGEDGPKMQDSWQEPTLEAMSLSYVFIYNDENLMSGGSNSVNA